MPNSPEFEDKWAEIFSPGERSKEIAEEVEQEESFDAAAEGRLEEYRDQYNKMMATRDPALKQRMQNQMARMHQAREAQMRGLGMMGQYAGGEMGFVAPLQAQMQANQRAQQIAALRASQGGSGAGMLQAMRMGGRAGMEHAGEASANIAMERGRAREAMLGALSGARREDIRGALTETDIEKQALAFEHARRMEAMGYLGMGEESVAAMLDAKYRAQQGLPPRVEHQGPGASPYIQAFLSAGADALARYGGGNNQQQGGAPYQIPSYYDTTNPSSPYFRP